MYITCRSSSVGISLQEKSILGMVCRKWSPYEIHVNSLQSIGCVSKSLEHSFEPACQRYFHPYTVVHLSPFPDMQNLCAGKPNEMFGGFEFSHSYIDPFNIKIF